MIMNPPQEREETKIMDFPEDWTIKKLSTIAVFKNGVNFEAIQKGKTGILTIDVLNMYGDNIFVNLENLYRINKQVNQSYLLKKGDILFVRSSLKREGVGWAAIIKDVKEPLTFCGFIIRAKLLTTDISPEFLTYYLRTNHARAGLISKSEKVSITNINQGMLRSIEVPIPPKIDQEKIVYVLSKIQAAREKSAIVLRSLKELKKSLLDHFFTYGAVTLEYAANVNLLKTEIGEIPKSWTLKRFQDVGEFQYGYTETASEKEIGPRFVRITDINLENNRIKWNKVPFCLITEREYSKYRLCEGDILIARIGATTGKTCIITIPPRSVFASYLIRFIPKNVKPLFVYYYTLSKLYWRQVAANKDGKIKKGVSSSQLKNFYVPVPPIVEQEEIVSILSAVDAKIEAEEKKKTACDELFKSLLSSLTSAKIRINNLEF
jgi:type I restriction enzyme, S subunit